MDDRFGVNSSYLAGENQYQHAHRKGKEGGEDEGEPVEIQGWLAMTVGRMQVCCCFIATALERRTRERISTHSRLSQLGSIAAVDSLSLVSFFPPSDPRQLRISED